MRAFTKKWSGTGTEKARSFYLVIGRYFVALAIGKRRVNRPLTPDTDDTK